MAFRTPGAYHMCAATGGKKDIASAGNGPSRCFHCRELQQIVKSKPEKFLKTIRCGDAHKRGLSSYVFMGFLRASI